MVTHKTLATTIASAALLASTAIAGTAVAADRATGPYFGVQYLAGVYDEPGVSTLHPSAVVGVLGARLGPYMAFEGRLGVGLSDDSTVYLGVPVSLDIDNLVGGYLRIMAPMGAGSDIFAAFGFTRTKLSASAYGVTVSETETDASFGFGVDVSFTRNSALRVEYLWLQDKPGYTLDALTIGYVASF